MREGRGTEGASSTSGGCSVRARRRSRAGRRAARATTSPRRWRCSTSCSSSASRASCTTPRGARCWTRRGKRAGCGCDGHGPRASRRGAPGPQGALRPLGPRRGPRSRCAAGKRSLGVAFPGRSAHAAGGPRAAAFDRLLMAAIIPPRRAPSALAASLRTLPQGRLRRPSAHHPDGLARYGFRFTESSCRPLGRGGEPLATARSRRVMDRSLRLAPIKSCRRRLSCLRVRPLSSVVLLAILQISASPAVGRVVQEWTHSPVIGARFLPIADIGRRLPSVCEYLGVEELPERDAQALSMRSMFSMETLRCRSQLS